MLRVLKVGLALLVVVALPLLVLGEAFAGGANLPPPTPGTLDTSGNITAVIVLDPNGPVPFGADFYAQPATATGTFGSIEITAGGRTAAGNFQVQPGTTLGPLRHGCNLTLTASRFVNFAPNGLPIGGPPHPNGTDPYTNWLPSYLTAKLFFELGIALTNETDIVKVPGIASVISQSCEPFPKPNKTDEDLAFGDIVTKQKVAPDTGAYPDLSAGDPQWVPGFLVLKVQIGLWHQ